MPTPPFRSPLTDLKLSSSSILATLLQGNGIPHSDIVTLERTAEALETVAGGKSGKDAAVAQTPEHTRSDN